MAHRRQDLRTVIVPGWLLCAYLVYAQAIPAFDYEPGISMGTLEAVATITEVGAAFWYGFAFGDLVVYRVALPAITLWALWALRRTASLETVENR